MEHFHEALGRGETKLTFSKKFGETFKIHSLFGTDCHKVVLIPFFVANEEIFGVTAHCRKLVFFRVLTGEEWGVVELFEGNF